MRLLSLQQEISILGERVEAGQVGRVAAANKLDMANTMSAIASLSWFSEARLARSGFQPCCLIRNATQIGSPARSDQWAT